MPKNRIHKQKDGRYAYSITVDGDRHNLYSWKNETKADFSKRCDELDKQAENASSSKIATETLDDLFELWKEKYVKNNLSVSEYTKTPELYENHVKPYLGNKKLNEIKRADIYMLLSRAQEHERELSPSTLKKIRGCVSRPFNWAINSLGLDLVCPTQGLRFSYKREIKDEADDIRVIPVDEFKLIVDSAKHSKYKYYVLIEYLTGLRPSEGLGLQINDLQGNVLKPRRAVTETEISPLKNKWSIRDFKVSDQVVEIFHKQAELVGDLTPEGWLFPSESGTPSMSAASQAFDRILKNTAVWKRGGRNGLKKLELIKPPLDYGLYDLRHSFATRMAEKKMNQKVLQKIMGHADITTTLKYYTHVTEKMEEEARELMVLNF